MISNNLLPFYIERIFVFERDRDRISCFLKTDLGYKVNDKKNFSSAKTFSKLKIFRSCGSYLTVYD